MRAAVDRLRAAVKHPAPMPVLVVMTRDEALEVLAAVDSAAELEAALTTEGPS